MKTEDIIKELELNYGYTFAKEGTDNKWQFEWLCEMINDVQNVVTKNCNLHIVSNRFSPEQMAEWFHDNYEEIAKAEGWQTQDKCRVEFKDLPKSNQSTMIKVCERWLNGC